MTKFDERTAANLDVVLENVCRGLPNGGDHETRNTSHGNSFRLRRKATRPWAGWRPLPGARYGNCLNANRP